MAARCRKVKPTCHFWGAKSKSCVLSMVPAHSATRGPADCIISWPHPLICPHPLTPFKEPTHSPWRASKAAGYFLLLPIKLCLNSLSFLFSIQPTGQIQSVTHFCINHGWYKSFYIFKWLGKPKSNILQRVKITGSSNFSSSSKVLLAHSPANFFTCFLMAAFIPQWWLSGYNKNHMVWKAYSVCSWELCRRSCLWSQAV